MATNKMTKKDYFKMAIAETSNAELIAFFNHEIELLERKNSNSTHKETATQKANADLKSKILDVMDEGTRYTITELGKLIGIESNQKVSALVRQLKMDNLVIRTEEKGKAYFTKAQEDFKKSSQKPLDKIAKMVYYKSVKREVLPNFLSLPLINQPTSTLLRSFFNFNGWLMSGQTSPTEKPLLPPSGAFCFGLGARGRGRPEFNYITVHAICQAKFSKNF